jgi:uncharacterized protein (DUF488 family)
MKHTLYTYGYTGGSIEDLRSYTAAGAVIVDTRYSPNSRAPQWRKEALEAVLGPACYQWVHSLGNRNYRSGGPISIVDLAHGLRILERLLKDGPVVLLCGCAEADGCHRKVVAEAAEKRLGCRVHHLAAGERLG